MIPQAFINEGQQFAPWTTFHLEELLATKLRALFQRKKGRDLFDLVVILKKFPDLDIEKMLQSFKEYMAFDEAKVSRAEFEANLAEKLNDESFVKDIFPLLPSSIATGYNQSSLGYNVSGSYAAAPYHPLSDVIHVQERIINRLPGESWKGKVAADQVE